MCNWKPIRNLLAIPYILHVIIIILLNRIGTYNIMYNISSGCHIVISVDSRDSSQKTISQNKLLYNCIYASNENDDV